MIKFNKLISPKTPSKKKDTPHPDSSAEHYNTPAPVP